MDLNTLLVETLRGLLTELTVGPPGQEAYVLNPGDRGLLESLRVLSAEQASTRSQGHSSIAAHTRHLHFGFNLMNRWMRGENPFADAQWNEAWRNQQVTEGDWKQLLTNLGNEITQWRENIGSREWEPVIMKATIGSVAHLAYHLGAIRQLNLAAAGPREPG